jgi:hypothetical protein
MSIIARVLGLGHILKKVTDLAKATKKFCGIFFSLVFV